MLITMTPHDLQVILELRLREILERVHAAKFIHPNGAILCGCPDCHQFRDMYEQLIRYLEARGEIANIHPFLSHGGAALLHEQSRLLIPSAEQIEFIRRNLPTRLANHPAILNLDDQLLGELSQQLRGIHKLYDFLKGSVMKGINSIHLYTHVPCGAAKEADIPVEMLLADHVMAHRRVQLLYPHLEVISFVHAHFPPDSVKEGKRLTYRLHVDGMARWLIQNTSIILP